MKRVFNPFVTILSLFFIFGCGESNSDSEIELLTNKNIYGVASFRDKPNYIKPIKDPIFGTKITRITGDPGDLIPNLLNIRWADEQLRHGYSKRQPWNCDESMIYLDKHSPDLWLDGKTYEVLFARDKPGSRVRWSHTQPKIMYYIDDKDGFIGKWNVVTDFTELVVDLANYKKISFGKGEGSFTNDGKKIAISAIRKNDNHEVIFMVDVMVRKKYADMDMHKIAKEIGNCTISPLGNYIVISGDFGEGKDRLQVRNSKTGDILYTETKRGMPSHFDVQIDQNGDEIVAGVAKTTTDKIKSGTIIKRVLSTGKISIISNYKYASHTSGRAYKKTGWVFVTYQNRDKKYTPYLNEIVAVRLDGNQTKRIAHLHSNKFNYHSESHGVPSPNGSRVMWASDWNTKDYPIQSYIGDYRK